MTIKHLTHLLHINLNNQKINTILETQKKINSIHNTLIGSVNIVVYLFLV